jgi:hypothetical protein
MCRTSTIDLSRLGGGNHQEKQEICSHNDPQVPLDAITQANTLGITQSHFGFAIKQERRVERSLLSSNDAITSKNDQESSLGVATTYL